MTGGDTALEVAVPAAILAAAAFGLTGALQHRAARRVPGGGPVRWGLVFALLRQPLWLVSLLANALGIVFQWLALSAAPLVFVQPLLVTSLVFAVFSSSALRRERPDGMVLLGATLCVAGLAAFFLVARPKAGHGRLELGEVLPLAAGLAVLIAAAVGVAIRCTGRARVMALATATGVLYGVTAGVTKLAADDLRRGVAALLTHWHFYVVVVCGVTGFLLSQNAFRVGVALAPALAVIVALDPLISIGVGSLWLGERLPGGGGPIAGQVLALAVAIAGIALLSQRAPQVSIPEAAETVASPVSPGSPVEEEACSERERRRW
ncbi:DMT family transporter [Prauserella cavernicola]|uniref:DMT family transporter n=1 Tax=Prauserella cavernicola TaxID=2800127 RepID=A0A934QM37_9PSEU|nr:DMT family transporter [Prauserella cavernicola]MBK1782796.1 DMT family transporter [Prauserella cavernicola]